jgi:hypothetical protein
MTLHSIPLNFLINDENFIFFFISVRLAKLSISTGRGSTSGGTRSFLQKKILQTLHPAREET